MKAKHQKKADSVLYAREKADNTTWHKALKWNYSEERMIKGVEEFA